MTIEFIEDGFYYLSGSASSRNIYTPWGQVAQGGYYSTRACKDVGSYIQLYINI